MLVCDDCYDTPQEQLRTIVLPADPQPVDDPRPERYNIDNNPIDTKVDLTPEVLKLDRGFVVTGHTGMNFSRINRDIRFAKDKTPYNPRMYVLFPDSPTGDGAELYIGITPELVTTGFRIYADSKSKTAPLTVTGQKRALENLSWIGKQKKRLGPKYESYWHAMEKGVWTKHEGWPTKPADWKNLRAWIVRRKMTTAAAMRPGFIADVGRAFRDVAPLCAFASSPKWKP